MKLILIFNIKIKAEKDIDMIDAFFALFNNEELEFFYSLPRFSGFNSLFCKLYLIFIYNYQRASKGTVR